MRPAHLHFLIYKPGFKTHISQVYVNDDAYLDTDVQFGVTQTLIGNYVRHETRAGARARRRGPVVFARLHLRDRARPSRLPQPPITGKAQGGRPVIPVLNR